MWMLRKWHCELTVFLLYFFFLTIVRRCSSTEVLEPISLSSIYPYITVHATTTQCSSLDGVDTKPVCALVCAIFFRP
jgi:hypothetical protein